MSAEPDTIHELRRAVDETAMALAMTDRRPASAATLASPVHVSMVWIDRCFLLALLIAAPLLYLPILTRNLPVAIGLDERNALEVLRRFHHGSLNPQFFAYPTLSFYLVWLLMLPLKYSSANVMLVGRMLDLVMIGVIAFVVYAFCRDRLHSRAAGVIAALLVLGSTEMANIVYVHPDLMMAAAGMASMYYLVDYFGTRSQRTWAFGMVLLGVTVGCKFTGFIFYVAYVAMEMLASLRQRRLSAEQRIVIPRFSQNACVAILLAVGGVLILGAWLAPWQIILAAVLKSRALYEGGPGAYYVEVFGRLPRMLIQLGLVSLGLGLLCRYARDVYESIAIKKIYYGLGIVFLLAIVCTPYMVLQPANFVFDLGALTRGIIIIPAGNPQWAVYAQWLFQDEGVVVLGLGLIGLAAFATKSNRKFQVLLLYVAIYSTVLGASKVGYSRYLIPLIAILSIAAGWTAVRLWQVRPVEGSRWTAMGYLRRVAVVLFLAVALVQTSAKVGAIRQISRVANSFFASYTAAMKATTGTAFYAGYAPTVELEEAGVKIKELTWASLNEGPLGQHLACGDTLIMSTALAEKNHVDARTDGSVNLLVDAAGTGQEAQQVVQKRGCPASGATTVSSLRSPSF